MSTEAVMWIFCSSAADQDAGSVCSPPPCGEGLGAGVMQWDDGGATRKQLRYPHPQPLASRSRIYPTSANLLSAELGQARVRMGRGGHRVRCEGDPPPLTASSPRPAAGTGW